MLRLVRSLAAWGSPGFADVLRREIEQLEACYLPLQQGLSWSSAVGAGPHRVRVIGIEETAGSIRVRAGIFYSGIIAGCSCADDPTPVDELNEYCEVQLDINKQTAETTVVLQDP